jgi:hypothetical protein
MSQHKRVAAWVRHYEELMGLNFAELVPQELFGRIKGRTLWFAGDSQVRTSWRPHKSANVDAVAVF